MIIIIIIIIISFPIMIISPLELGEGGGQLAPAAQRVRAVHVLHILACE